MSVCVHGSVCPTVRLSSKFCPMERKTTTNDGFPIATHYSQFGLCDIRQHRPNML